ncbi:MAG: ferrochelatase [Acidobacteria bacterium]|nr:ferrochelatase [Acidobacteriota bacterium]
MAEPFDAVLMVAFGGPTKPEEIRPFLANVLRGVPVPPGRLEEVAHHYEVIGGKSPINDLTFRQAKSLARLLDLEGPRLPVYVGMRHWHPLASEAVTQMMQNGARRAVGLVMAAHDSGPASWGKYVKAVSDALESAGPGAPRVEYVPACYNHPDFIGAMAEQVGLQLDAIPPERRGDTALIFTAHSIPTKMAEAAPYVQQLLESCQLVAKGLGHTGWSLAYQSRSGDPRERWLEPDVSDVLHKLSSEGCRSVVLAPIGFVCDHAEVLFDLDVEVKAEAGSLGIELRRASTVNDHPLFIRALADLVRELVQRG